MSFGLARNSEGEEEYSQLQQPIADQRRPAQRRPRAREEEEHEYPRNARQRLEEDSEPEEPAQQFHPRSSLENIAGDPSGEALGGERKKQWKPYIPNMFDPFLLDQFEKEHIPDPDWGFLEWYSESNLREEDQAPIRKLIQYVTENWEKTSMTALMIEAQKYYNKEIRAKYAELTDKPWPLRKIYEYFSVTNPPYTIMKEEEIKTLYHASLVISKHEMMEVDEYIINNELRRDFRVNKDALMKFLKCTLRIDQLQDKLGSSRSRHQQ